MELYGIATMERVPGWFLIIAIGTTASLGWTIDVDGKMICELAEAAGLKGERVSQVKAGNLINHARDS